MKIAATVLRTLEKNRLGYYYVIYYMIMKNQPGLLNFFTLIGRIESV